MMAKKVMHERPSRESGAIINSPVKGISPSKVAAKVGHIEGKSAKKVEGFPVNRITLTDGRVREEQYPDEGG